MTTTTNQYRSGEVLCHSPVGYHRMAYVEWGDPDNDKLLLCVHGLTRCSRDFDYLAQSLCHEYRVVCPDIVGRGCSDRLSDPMHYAVPQYAQDIVTLLARLDVASVDYLGTSMGGMIGMCLAAQRPSELMPLRCLILNDVGPLIPAAAAQRIGEYLGTEPEFDSLAAAQAYIQQIASPFGKLSDAQWRHLTEHVVIAGEHGKLRLRYDPAIAKPFQMAFLAQGGKAHDIDLWPWYEAIRCPTLVVRGANSDVLTHETLVAMQTRGPRPQVVEVADVGHAPMFMDDQQVALVSRFLELN